MLKRLLEYFEISIYIYIYIDNYHKVIYSHNYILLICDSSMSFKCFNISIFVDISSKLIILAYFQVS